MKSEKDLELPLYYDLYGGFLTDKQANVVELYYNDDLSLAEIAAETGTTRQAVMDILSRARKKMYDMEQKLGLVTREKRDSGI